MALAPCVPPAPVPSWRTHVAGGPDYPSGQADDGGMRHVAGRWGARHLNLVETMDRDVLLLTEVSERLDLPGYDVHLGRQMMAPKRRWAAIASRLSMSPQPDPLRCNGDGRPGGSACLLLYSPVALLRHQGPLGGGHHY
jgi:hypothetical protein